MLDFKKKFYKFAEEGAKETVSFLKDVIAFSNTIRNNLLMLFLVLKKKRTELKYTKESISRSMVPFCNEN